MAVDIFKILIQSNTFNFILVISLIIFLIVKLNLKDKIENLRTEIQEYVDNSVQEKETAEKELSIINSKIEKLPAVIQRINKSAENNINNMRKNMQEKIEDKKQDIDNNVDRILNLETKKFKSKLVKILSEKSIELVENNTLNQLDSNKELHNKYIENAIAEIDRIEL